MDLKIKTDDAQLNIDVDRQAVHRENDIVKWVWLPHNKDNPFYKIWMDVSKGDDKTARLEWEGGHFSEWREWEDKNMTSEERQLVEFFK